MAVTPNHIVITNPDGSTITVDVTYTPAVGPVVPPPPVTQFPDGANTVTINGISFPAAIDPPTTDPTQPGGRGQDKLIIITNPATPARNQWGWEALVDIARGKIVSTSLHEVMVPGTYVLSGNGLAALYLSASARTGAAVQVTKRVVITPTTPVADYPIMGEYVMDGVGHVSQLYPKCNRALIAFYQGTDLVEWGGDSPAQTATDLTAWEKIRTMNEVVISLGGQGGNVNLDQVDEGMARINKNRFPIMGIDLDAEAFGYSPGQALGVSQASADACSKAPKDFVVQFPPPGGSPVGLALTAAKLVQSYGFRVYFGQQLYETTITDKDVMDATLRAVDVLGPPAVLIGIMIGDSHNSWTLQNVGPRMQMVKDKWKDIGGAYVWDSSRLHTAEVVSTVGGILGL